MSALRELALSFANRKMAFYRRAITKLEKKYQMNFQEFSKSIKGKATIEEEDDWIEWKAALTMLEGWKQAKRGLLENAR